MSDDKLKSLSRLRVGEADPEARRRALAASLSAFDAAEATQPVVSRPAQGSQWAERLKSIFHALKGSWTMDMRIPIGTAAIALLLLPLGYQLYTTTAMSPVAPSQLPTIVTDTPAQPPVPVANTEASPAPLELAEAKRADESTQLAAAPPPPMAPATAMNVSPSGNAAAEPLASQFDAEMSRDAVAAPLMEGGSGRVMAPSTGVIGGLGADTFMANGGTATQPATESWDLTAPSTSIASMPESTADRFRQFEDQRVIITAEQPVSTFSIDVDTASYAFVRNTINGGYLPPADAVRVEEMINYFSYDYPGPDSAEVPFKATVAVYPTPWNDETQLLQIGIKGYEPPATVDVASNLVLLIDTSGSMDEPDKLPLLKRAFGLLIDQLSANDTVSIVVYAGSAGVVLEPTKATEKTTILKALDGLAPGGSTAGAEGIELAYQLAEEAQVSDGVNRVILATDGDFNVGISDPNQLRDYIKTKRDEGISLSVLGFGQGNYNDEIMQSLAQNGNGNASYIDSVREAQKVLVEEMGGTLETIAQDVKIQVEFNPALVAEYRLIGYETRALNREDFNNDRVDAGDIGAGHTVTAIYEITPVGSDARLIAPLRYGTQTDPVATGDSEIAFLKMRFKLPGQSDSQLVETPIGRDVIYDQLDAAPVDLRFAASVAAFGQKLRGADVAAEMSYAEIAQLARNARGSDEGGYRSEFVQLVETAKLLAGEH